MFEQSSREALRFNVTGKGCMTDEDLWRLPRWSNDPDEVTLDSIAKSLNNELKSAEEETFVKSIKPDNTKLQLKLSIVKHIIKTLEDEEEVAKKKAESEIQNKALREQILAALAEKQQRGVNAKTEEELEEMLKQLQS